MDRVGRAICRLGGQSEESATKDRFRGCFGLDLEGLI